MKTFKFIILIDNVKWKCVLEEKNKKEANQIFKNLKSEITSTAQLMLSGSKVSSFYTPNIFLLLCSRLFYENIFYCFVKKYENFATYLSQTWLAVFFQIFYFRGFHI